MQLTRVQVLSPFCHVVFVSSYTSSCMGRETEYMSRWKTALPWPTPSMFGKTTCHDWRQPSELSQDPAAPTHHQSLQAILGAGGGGMF